MKFIPAGLEDAFVIDPDLISDERGSFARTYCQSEVLDHGVKANVVKCKMSYNKNRGTLRGMHYQQKPNAEAKLVRCTAGAIYDVIIDLREDSPTFTQWVAYELTSENRKAVYVPEGFAHGFQTLEDNTEVFYQMYNFFSPESASGVRWDDSAFKITWPLSVHTLSDKDASYPDFVGVEL